MDEANGNVTSSRGQKRLLDTATMASELAQANKATAVSSKSGAKIANNLEELAKELEKLLKRHQKHLLVNLQKHLKPRRKAARVLMVGNPSALKKTFPMA